MLRWLLPSRSAQKHTHAVTRVMTSSTLRMRKQMGAGGLREEKRRVERRAGQPVTVVEREPTARCARVLYDFEGQQDGDLSLQEG